MFIENFNFIDSLNKRAFLNQNIFIKILKMFNDLISF